MKQADDNHAMRDVLQKRESVSIHILLCTSDILGEVAANSSISICNWVEQGHWGN